MKILVPLKRVIDYNVRIRVKSDKTGVLTDGVKMSINPFDEIALEEAIRIHEAGIATEVLAVTIGSSSCQESLRTALALGAHRAILVETREEAQPLDVAKILKALIQKESPSLVIMGKQAIDDDCNQTGQMLAGLLNWPQGTFISHQKISDSSLEVIREVDGGLETLSLKIPAILTTDLRLNEPRYASLPNIMKAKQKPLDILKIEDLGIKLNPRLRTLKVEEPPARKEGIRVGTTQELIDKLKNEVKVI